MLSLTFFVNVFYLVLFCIHVCVDDVIEKNTLLIFTETNLTIREIVNFVTSVTTLPFCDLINRKSFEIMISEHLA